LRRSRELIAVSEYVQRAIGSLTEARITVIDNPVADRYFSVGDRRMGRGNGAEPPSPPTVLFAGGITRRKNILGLVQAIALLHRDGASVELRIAGGVRDEQYFRGLQQFVAAHSLQRHIRFLGQLAEPALLEEYERCTIVASASHEETAGMIFQQAMAAGVPVVGTRAGGVPSIVCHDESGILTAPGDPAQLAEGLRVTLADPARRWRFAVAGRRIALDRFTVSRAAERTVALYRDMIMRARLPDRDLPI
jgi:glycosyltransferase involved in cell wall biosynthesis